MYARLSPSWGHAGLGGHKTWDLAAKCQTVPQYSDRRCEKLLFRGSRAEAINRWVRRSVDSLLPTQANHYTRLLAPPADPLSVRATASSSWQSWDRRRWNSELFRRYFVAEDGDARPVRRLTIGPDELAQVAAAPAEATEVQEAFERAMREGCSARRLEQRLSLGAHDDWARAGSRGDPPYVADLLFTCYAAALVDEDTIDVGDFRERLRLLLDHDPTQPVYPLEELGRLWERFAAWLRIRHAQGAPFRELVLPDCGHETRIGYSKRLVFPLRRDRQALIEVLAGADVEREPPIRDVLSLLSRTSRRFTPAFQLALDKALQAFRHARPDEHLDLLWSAVRDAAVLAEARAPKSDVRYQLFAMLDEEFRGDFVLMAAGKPRRVPRGLEVRPSDVPLGRYDHLVMQVGGSRGGPDGAVRLLLAGALDASLSGFERSVPGRIATQGVLLFTVGEDGVRELIARRPHDDRVWALVADRWRAPLLALFPTDARPVARPSRYSGWHEVGPFDGAYLARLDEGRHSGLERLRCLQPTRLGVSIHLSGGVRVDGGYLALRAVLPSARVEGADRIVAYALQTSSTGSSTTEQVAALIATPDDPSLFRFPHDFGEGKEGRINLVAYREQSVVATRQLTLRPRLLGQPFLEVSEPSRWWVEGTETDVLSAADPVAQAPWNQDLGAAEGDPSREGAGSRLASRAVSRGVTLLPAEIEPPREMRVDDDEGTDRFVEWAAGLATVRRGLGEGELLDMAEDCFGPAEWATRWDLLRAWAEVGCFDVLTRRDWRGRTWFARPARLVVVQTVPEVVVALVGLAGWAMRRRTEQVMAVHGARPVPSRGFTRQVATVPRWVLPDLATAMRAANALEFAHPQVLEDPTRTAARIASVRRVTVGEQPRSGELRGTWDWARSQFTPKQVVSARNPTVEWWSRTDGPDYFVVRSTQGTDWWTPSRTWALLVAHVDADVRAYGPTGDRLLLREVGGGPYLPLPVARAVACHAGVSPGPCTRLDGRLTYAYAFTDPLERDRLLECLWGAERAVAPLARRIRWLLAVSSSARDGRDGAPAQSLRPLPPELRRALAAMDDVPGATTLATALLPTHLIPHVRHLVSRSAR